MKKPILLDNPAFLALPPQVGWFVIAVDAAILVPE
jgi:hypothetical protein